MAGALSRQTYISCETRHGIYGNIFASPLLVDQIRLAVVDDVIENDAIHLLRVVPKAWLRSDYLTRFEDIDLTEVLNLTQAQIDISCGNLNTRVPKGRWIPDTWPCPNWLD